MAECFQKEIPKARINITLDLETEGGRKKKELPLKILALGNFSNGKTKEALLDRQRININKNNFNRVIADLSPSLHFSVPNTIKNDRSELGVYLEFKEFRDFHPDQIVKQIPVLNQLIAMRTLLKELKSNILDNHQFRKALETLSKDKQQLLQLHQEIKNQAPLIEEL